MQAGRNVPARIGAALVVTVLVAGCNGSPARAHRSGAATTTAAERSPSTRGGFPPVDDPARDGSLIGVTATATRVATLDFPVAIVQRPGSDDLYVAERAGRVRRLHRQGDAITVAPETVLDISKDTTTDSNRGMFGLAFSPDGATLYVSHTNARGDGRVASYAMSGTVAVATTRNEIFRVAMPHDDHNGGDIHVGADGMIWLALGDGGGWMDPGNRAADPSTPLGKLVRIDPANPTPVVYAVGFRNPWRFSFDRATGDLFINDVGQESWEEIDYLPAGTPAGTDFGWSGFEGTHVLMEQRVRAGSTPPIFEMSHDAGWCAGVGGVVYRGAAIPALTGVYLFTDICKTHLYGMRVDGGKVVDERALPVDVDQVVSIDEDASGEVWLSSATGGVYRLDPL